MENFAMVQITIEEMSDHLFSYLQRVQSGESFVVISQGRAIAELKPAETGSQSVPKSALEKFQELGLVGCMDGLDNPPTDHPEIQDYLNQKRQQERL